LNLDDFFEIFGIAKFLNERKSGCDVLRRIAPIQIVQFIYGLFA
jgi:hypothetical protein